MCQKTTVLKRGAPYMISPLGHKWILTPHSWCEPGNQKDWPIRGEHSVYRIFNFDDMDIEKKEYDI